MNLKEILGKYVDNPPFRKKAKIGLYVFLGATVVADFIVPHEHKTFFWDSIPGFWSLYGALSTFLMIVVSKAIGHVWLMKPEDYYD